MVFTPNVDPDQSLLQVKAGQSDLDIAGNVPTSSADLAATYGVNKGRFWVGATFMRLLHEHELEPSAVQQRQAPPGR